MSFDNRRFDRIQKIKELLALNPQGLLPQTIAKETGILSEITKKRLFMYIEELKWSGEIVVKRNGRVALVKEKP